MGKLMKNNPKLNIEFQNLPIDDPKNRRPNIELAEKYLNWKPLVNLDEGLNKFIKFYKMSHELK